MWLTQFDLANFFRRLSSWSWIPVRHVCLQMGRRLAGSGADVTWSLCYRVVFAVPVICVPRRLRRLIAGSVHRGIALSARLRAAPFLPEQCRQFQERCPDAPNEWQPNHQPGDKKLEDIAS